jgi:signal transduction histidine kinase
MASTRQKSLWRYLGPLALVLWLVALVLLAREPIMYWLEGEERYDKEALREWIQESRINRTLPELIREYINLSADYRSTAARAQDADRALAQAQAAPGANDKVLEALRDQKEKNDERADVALKDLNKKRAELRTQLKSMADPIKVYTKQLVLFPIIYKLELTFPPELELAPMVWDSELPRQEGQFEHYTLRLDIPDGGFAYVTIDYQLHVYNIQQKTAKHERARRLWLFFGMVVVIVGLVLLFFNYQAQERRRLREQRRAEQQLNEAQRRQLEEELRRQLAERKQEEAERVNLELKSQLWANIGIMAGSYAHNIKNLLVRPNDLLSRCLEADGLSGVQGQMLQEVRQTLGTVTERLQQILQTVRRDPTQALRLRLDLNQLVEDMRVTWQELGREKWKMATQVESAPQPLWIEGDPSHLQQALENLLFNARDATFEMRNYLREQARKTAEDRGSRIEDRGSKIEDRERKAVSPPSSVLDPQFSILNPRSPVDRRGALIAAASWKGEVALRTLREDNWAILEVQDNGIGMTEEVRQRCTEAHFSTKRNNALFAGLSAGMGLGLSFVLVILEHHRAELSISSEPLRGTTFRIRFPMVMDKR